MQNSPFTLANRKQLADLLGNEYRGLRDKARDAYRQKERTLRRALINDYAEKKGATKLKVQVEAAEAKIRELKMAISTLGFELDGPELSFSDRRTNPLDKIIDDRIEKELGPIDAIDARFDSAQIAMMTVASLEDADKLLKSVTEI